MLFWILVVCGVLAFAVLGLHLKFKIDGRQWNGRLIGDFDLKCGIVRFRGRGRPAMKEKYDCATCNEVHRYCTEDETAHDLSYRLRIEAEERQVLELIERAAKPKQAGVTLEEIPADARCTLEVYLEGAPSASG